MRAGLLFLGGAIALALCGGEVSAATTYEYDTIGRLTKVTYSNGTVIQYTYDVAGNRTAYVVTP